MYWTVHLEGGPRRVNHAAAAVADLIYSFGGYNSVEDFNERRPMDVHILNTGNLRWHQLPNPSFSEYQQDDRCIPFQRYGHTAVTYGRKIYVWGGRNEETACNQIFCFDADLLTWSRPKASGMVPAARDGHTACVINHRMYIFGGFEEEIDRFSNDVYYLDLQTMKWHYVMASGETAKYRDFHSAAAIGSCMYVFGGRGDLDGPYGSHNEEYCRDIIYFDTESNRWYKPVTSGDIPGGRRSHSSFIVNGLLYIFGGYNGITEEHFNDLHCYNPWTCEWRLIKPHGKPPVRRRRQSCVAVNNKVYLFGGTCPLVEVLGVGPAHNNINMPEMALEELVADQNHFDADNNINNQNHNDNLGEGNVDDFQVFNENIDQILPVVFPIGHDDQNQNVAGNQDDSEGEDDPFFEDADDGTDPKLMDLNDLHVLDFMPSLRTLCLKIVVDHKLDRSALPPIIRKELYYFTTPNTISQ